MTHGDPRGHNIIPFGRRTLEQLRTATRNRPAPPERPLPLSSYADHAPGRLNSHTPLEPRPWPFNCLGPSPYHRATLPPVDADRFVNARFDGVGVAPVEEWGDKFHFREDMEIRDRHELEMQIDCVLIQHRHDHPDCRLLDFVPVLLKIVKKLLRMSKLPSR
jgi:hypothetical protein